MKKLLSLVLVLVLMLSAIPFAAAENAADVNIPIILPLLETLYSAERTSASASEDGQRAIFVYSDATQDDLDYFMILSSICGTYFMDMELDEAGGAKGYFLIVPGTAYDGYVLLDTDKDLLYVNTTLDAGMLNEETLENLTTILSTEIKLPADATGNVFPEFHAVTGIQPYRTGTIADLDIVFDGRECWTEWYGDIGTKEMRLYVTYMTLFGFEVYVDMIDISEDGVTNPCQLRFTNGDAEVIILYDALNQIANLYYEPGIAYTLLSADDLNEALGD